VVAEELAEVTEHAAPADPVAEENPAGSRRGLRRPRKEAS
jgi:hypothetical protein